MPEKSCIICRNMGSCKEVDAKIYAPGLNFKKSTREIKMIALAETCTDYRGI